MTDFDVLSLSLRSPLHFVEFDASSRDDGHLIIETVDEFDAFMLLFSLDNAKLG